MKGSGGQAALSRWTGHGGRRQAFGAAGVTLVEMLVVLAIIGIITAAVVPIVSFYTNPRGQDLGARSLFTVMKAAQVYASTHNVKTAVCFNVRAFTDSQTGDPALAMTEYRVARQLKPDEVNERREQLIAMMDMLAMSNYDIRGAWYVPIGTDAGQFREFEGEAAVLGEFFPVATDEFGDVAMDEFGVPILLSTTGMSAIRVLLGGEDFELVEPSALNDMTPDLLAAMTGKLPAYVWQPDGTLQVADQFQPQRVVIRMGLRPDRAIEERYLMTPGNGAVETDTNGAAIQIATPLVIYHSTGRIAIAD